MRKERCSLPPGFTVTAHSGCMGRPANSLQAMQAGADAGAQIVEFDLRFTQAGEPVLSHGTPDRSSVSLREAFVFLRQHPALRANVDVKDTSHLETVLPLARETGVLPQIFFTGVRTQDVPAVREKCPGVPYYWNTVVRRKDDADALAAQAASLGAIGVNMHVRYLSPRVVQACHARGLLVSVWTVDSARKARKALRMLPDNITTNRPDMLLSLA